MGYYYCLTIDGADLLLELLSGRASGRGAEEADGVGGCVAPVRAGGRPNGQALGALPARARDRVRVPRARAYNQRMQKLMLVKE